MKGARWAGIGCALVAAWLVPGQAFGNDHTATIFEHLGSTDPLTEGWGGSGGFAVLDDLDSGFDAWATVDDSPLSAQGAYVQVVTDPIVARGNAFGWSLSARLRVAEVPDEPNPDVADGSPALLYRDGDRTWQIHFGPTNLTFLTQVETSSGLVESEISVPVSGATSSHRLYELRYHAGSQTADLFIDEVEVLSDVTGAPFGPGFPIPKSVYWGSASTEGVGQANFSLVRFEVGTPSVPAMSPSAMLVLSVLLTGLGALGLESRR